jgi:hypothetical protein
VGTCSYSNGEDLNVIVPNLLVNLTTEGIPELLSPLLTLFQSMIPIYGLKSIEIAEGTIELMSSQLNGDQQIIFLCLRLLRKFLSQAIPNGKIISTFLSTFPRLVISDPNVECLAVFALLLRNQMTFSDVPWLPKVISSLQNLLQNLDLLALVCTLKLVSAFFESDDICVV